MLVSLAQHAWVAFPGRSDPALLLKSGKVLFDSSFHGSDVVGPSWVGLCYGELQQQAIWVG